MKKSFLIFNRYIIFFLKIRLCNLGGCSKSFQTVSELENYLAKIANASDLEEFRPKFNNNYIETRYDPSQRFLEILKEIEKKR